MTSSWWKIAAPLAWVISAATCLALGFEHVGDDDLGALAGEDARHAGAHAGGAAGDQRDLVFEPHLLALPVIASSDDEQSRRT